MRSTAWRGAALALILLASCSGPAPRRSPLAGRRADSAASGNGAGNAAAAPPRAREVALRALVLRAVTEVALFPRAGEETSAAVQKHFEAERARIIEWLERQGALEAASARERQVLSSPVGSLERQAIAEVSGGREALLVTLWALGQVPDIPGYDKAAPSLNILARRLPSIGAPAADFVRGARLRPEEEVLKARETAEIWHWRARARERTAAGSYAQGEELDGLVQDLEEKARGAAFRLGPIRDGESFFRELIRFAAFYAHARGLIPKPIGEDFPALGRRYAELSQRSFQRLSAIAAERHHALNWLAGYADDWDAVPTDT